MQFRPFFSGQKPCTFYSRPEGGPPWGVSGLPGDIFVKTSWGEESVRHCMGLFHWSKMKKGIEYRHPEEDDFVYKMDSEHLENEGWFYHPKASTGARHHAISFIR